MRIPFREKDSLFSKCVDDKLLPLTSEDIEVCMAHSFAFEKESHDVKIPNEESEDEKELVPKVFAKISDNKQLL